MNEMGKWISRGVRAALALLLVGAMVGGALRLHAAMWAPFECPSEVDNGIYDNNPCDDEWKFAHFVVGVTAPLSLPLLGGIWLSRLP